MSKVLTVTEKVNFENVSSFYTGRPGCMCGCNGNYRYNSLHAEAAGKNRGYAVGADEISDRAVKMGVTKFNKLIDEGLVKTYEQSNGSILFYDTPTRTNVMYLTGYFNN